MRAWLILKLAWRSLWRNRRRTLITCTSITFGLALALCFKALAVGLNAKSIEQATRLGTGHLTIEEPRYRDDPSPASRVPSVARVRAAAAPIPGIERLRPQVHLQGMVAAARGSVGVALVGLEPDAERTGMPFASHLVDGRFLESRDERAVLVGATLAGRYRLGVGKKLVFTTTNARGELVSELLRVAGVFRLNLEEVDGFVVVVPLAVARRIAGLGDDEATRVGVLLSAPDAQESVRERLTAALAAEPVAVRTWQETLPEVAAVVAVDQSSKAMLANIILLLVAFTILNTILMSVVERGREFAVSLALGTEVSTVRLQVLAEAALLGAMGCAAGVALGGGASLWAEAHGLDLAAFFPGEVSAGGTSLDLVVFPRLTAAIAAKTTLFVYAMTLAAGLYPMLRSTRLAVAETLRTR